MKQQIKELTLLLLYLTSWDEKESFGTFKRSWKGYPFDILSELTNQEFIFGSKRAKSVYFTDKGIKEAEVLVEKYFGENI